MHRNCSQVGCPLPALARLETYSTPYQPQRLTGDLCESDLGPAIIRALAAVPAFVVVKVTR